jgi:hypothetical protein
MEEKTTAYRSLARNKQKERDHYEDLDVLGRIMFR